jgi:hypothetical protein
MPMFTLHRSFILRTTKGHSIGFVKGVPSWVPPICIEDAVAIGAQPVEEGVSVLPPENAPVVELTPEQREQKLFKAFELLLARNERGDFTASNQPHCKKLTAIVDFEVPIPERDEAWRKFRLQRDAAEAMQA